MTHKHRIAIGAGLLTAIVAGVYWKHASVAGGSLAKSSEQKGGLVGQKSVQAQLFEIKKDRLPDSIDGLIGTVKGNTIELTFNGQEERLEAVHVRVGERVSKGDVLFELDHTRNEARKSQAESNWARAKELLAVGGATQRDVDEAEAAFKIAKKDYDDTFIYAPQSGIVSQINRQEGESVTRNEVVAVLVSSNDRFYLETGVIEGQIEQVRAGQRAVVELEAFGNAQISGHVQGVSREVTTTGRTGTVLVWLPGDVQSKLRPGMSGRCKIYVFDEETFPIPRTAYDTDKQGIYVVEDDHKAHFIKVGLGHITRDYYEMKEGVAEGDRIINDVAATPVQDGADVTQEGELLHYKNPEAPVEKS